MSHYIKASRAGTILSQKSPNLDESAFISFRDMGSPKLDLSKFGDAPALSLVVDDLNNDQLSLFERFVFDRCASESFQKILNDKQQKQTWPFMPFTPYHANQIITFAKGVGYSKNIYVFCEYGRSRSVTVASWLKENLFPGFGLEISREDAVINTRIKSILNRVHGG